MISRLLGWVRPTLKGVVNVVFIPRCDYPSTCEFPNVHQQRRSHKRRYDKLQDHPATKYSFRVLHIHSKCSVVYAVWVLVNGTHKDTGDGAVMSAALV